MRQPTREKKCGKCKPKIEQRLPSKRTITEKSRNSVRDLNPQKQRWRTQWIGRETEAWPAGASSFKVEPQLEEAYPLKMEYGTYTSYIYTKHHINHLLFE
ncbi:hypothetical protein ABEV00_11815 [Paenibacillus thiaminolyticus]|uniref:hypothetical protein n=1 Tax=Paenibacillus TaxID=44249 RepID=UPI00105A94F6|nr:hypothetical protein [Paenibacillus dendritiformis]TDL49257.1 hypothetical protein E2R60_24895 [Paenibacillus dendritiformis]